MNIEQQTEEKRPESEENKEEQKNNVPGVMTAQLMELKINSAVAVKKKSSIADLETRALHLVKNEDNLKEMAALLKDIDEMEDIAEETYDTLIKPLTEGVKNGREGKKLVFENTARIRGMFKPD